MLFLSCSLGEASDDPLHGAKTQGLRVGFSIEPPYAFVDSAGEATGEAPEVLRHVARELGITELQWFPLAFHDLVPALLAGRVDVVASGLFVTPERSRQVRFSRPTACVEPALVKRRARGTHRAPPRGDEDCQHCRVAVIQGSVEQRAFEREGGFSLVVVPDLATAVASLSEGSVDAVAISAPTGRALVRTNSELELDGRELPERVAEEAGGCAGLAFRPDDVELATAFDRALLEFVGSSAHLSAVRPFGFTEQEMPCARDVPARRGTAPRACAASNGLE